MSATDFDLYKLEGLHELRQSLVKLCPKIETVNNKFLPIINYTPGRGKIVPRNVM